MVGRSAVDYHESELVRLEGLKSQIEALQIRHLRHLDRAQVATADGSRSFWEWVGARLDISREGATALVRTMRRIEARPDLMDSLAKARATFDRVEALSRIPDDVGLLEHLDVAGVRREAALRTRITSEDELRTADERFLVIQPSLDESWWKLWGGLDDPPPTQVTVFIDAAKAADSNGQTGIFLEAGPRVGVNALAAILCNATTEVIARTEDGRTMEYGRGLRVAPPSLRRAVLLRDGNVCVADACESRYRLEAHHLVPWSEGGQTDPDNLITLCWFHHHVVVHERGFKPFRHPDHGRVRFRPPDRPR